MILTKRFEGYLDFNDKNPELFGDAILLRDDDGIGFYLGLESLKGKYVKIIITPIDEPEEYKNARIRRENHD